MSHSPNDGDGLALSLVYPGAHFRVWHTRKTARQSEGMCRLKSPRLFTSKPLQAPSPESCKVPAKELLSWRNRFKDSLNKTPRNQAQQNPPRMPVSARASR